MKEQDKAEQTCMALVHLTCSYWKSGVISGQEAMLQVAAHLERASGQTLARQAQAEPVDIEAIQQIAEELELEACAYEGDFADTVNGCADALRHLIDNRTPVAPASAQNADQAGLCSISMEPVMADGKTALSDYLENTLPDDHLGDDWTKGFEECRRRLFRVVGAQLRALRRPTKDKFAGQAIAPASAQPDGWIAPAYITGELTSVAFKDLDTANATCAEGNPIAFFLSPLSASAQNAEAIRNAALEEAAKVADGHHYGPCGEYDYSYGEASAEADDRAEQIAGAIRALQSGTATNKEGGAE